MLSNTEFEISCIKSSKDLSNWSVLWANLFTSQANIDSSCSYFRLGGDCQTLYQISSNRPIYILHQKGEIKALIALKSEKSTIGKLIKTASYSSGEHYVSDMVLAPGVPSSAISMLFKQIFKDRPEILWIGFNRITENLFSRLASFIEKTNWPALADYSTKHLSYVTKDTTIEQFESELGKSTRHNMRKYWKRLETEKGNLSLVFALPNSTEENSLLFNQFLELEASGWKGDESSAIKSKPLSLSFHQHMTETASSAGKLIWAKLSVEESPIAMLLVLNRGDKLWVVKTAYNEDFKQYSPGSLLTYKLIQYAIDSNAIDEIDMITEYDWHKRWNPTENQYYSLRIFNSSLKARLVKELLVLKRSGWKRLDAIKYRLKKINTKK